MDFFFLGGGGGGTNKCTILYSKFQLMIICMISNVYLIYLCQMKIAFFNALSNDLISIFI